MCKSGSGNDSVSIGHSLDFIPVLNDDSPVGWKEFTDIETDVEVLQKLSNADILIYLTQFLYSFFPRVWKNTSLPNLVKNFE